MSQIKELERYGPPEPEWKQPRPRSRALIASTAGVNIVLTAIGAEAHYMEGIDGLNTWFEGFIFDPGIWVVEFWIWTGSYDTDCGREYDEELRLVETRLATKEEVEAQRNDEWPWDPDEWMENWPEVRDWKPVRHASDWEGDEEEALAWQAAESRACLTGDWSAVETLPALLARAREVGEP